MRTFFEHAISRAAIVAAAISTLTFGCGGGSSGGSAGSSGSGGAGGSGGDACAPYVTSPARSAVTVRLTNNTAADLYIGPTTPPGCGSVDPFSVTGPNGEALPWRSDVCSFTCEQMISGACACPASCAVPETILIQAGGHRDVAWDGTLFFSEDMPASCYSSQCGVASSCYVEREPPQGTLTFNASAWTEIGMCMMMPCTCTPDANGSCSFSSFDAVVSGTENKAQASVTMIGQTIQLDFN